MKVLLVHNRYRSLSPGGEDRVVDQESDALASDGHTVERFERYNDDIATWSMGRKALLPAQVQWSDETRRSLRLALRGPSPCQPPNRRFAVVKPSTTVTGARAFVSVMQHLVGVAEIAEMLGVTRQRVDQLVREPALPHSRARSRLGAIWRRASVEEWARRTGRL